MPIAQGTPSAPVEGFPFDVVRDLLGICRAIGLATPLGNRERRARLREIGDTLVRSLELAHRYEREPASWGYFSAQNLARDATRRLGDEIGALMPAPPVLHAAEARVDWPAVGRAERRRKSG